MLIKDFILCDDIRQEIGQKISIIGIYGDNIQFFYIDINKDKWPKIMKTSVFVRAEKEVNDTQPNKFEMKFYYQDKEFLKAEGNIPDQPSNIINIIVINNAFQYIGEGEYSIKLNLFSNDKKIFEKEPCYFFKVLSLPLSEYSPI